MLDLKAAYNKVRKLRSPKIDNAYVAGLLRKSDVNVSNVSIERLEDGLGFNNFYYRIRARTESGEQSYFASIPDKSLDLLRRVGDFITGIKNQTSLDRKRKEHKDLEQLSESNISATRPVAFDSSTGMSIEPYYEGTSLKGYLKNKNPEDSKLQKCREALTVIRDLQHIGKHSAEYITDNFLVTPNGVMITDMETEFENQDPAQDLAVFLYSASQQLAPEKVLSLAREKFSAKTINRALNYGGNYLSLLGIDKETVKRTNQAIESLPA